MKHLNQLDFDNSFSRLPESFHTPLDATPLAQPKFVAFSSSAGQLLNIEDTQEHRELLTAYCSGNEPWPGAEPVASVYSGHQFGSYVPQLGDGRALLLGEVRNSLGEKWDLHLKGSGPTPYSRFGDGRAVLRSCIREYLCSEAIHHLGIPTTRALCIVTSETPVYRETTEQGSTLLRLAKSHIRFGHFEYFYYTKRHEDLKTLADYVIEQSYPHLTDKTDRYPLMLEQVVARTAKLIAQWQAVGFAHGVMNTDNMSIIGDTIDYGPFGFMDDMNWHFICNHSDHNGRYAFSQQPEIGYWNCSRLAQALLPLIEDVEAMQKILDRYPHIYSKYYKELMLQKLGFAVEEEEDTALIQDLLQVMHNSHCDYTRFFRVLSEYNPDNQSSFNPIESTEFNEWLERYTQRLKRNLVDNQTRCQQMKQVNPKFILRNYLAQEAIEKAEQGDYSDIDNLMTVLSSPYDEHPQFEYYAEPPPEWGKKLEVSCSS